MPLTTRASELGRVYTPAPVSDSPLNQGLTSWWLGLPGQTGGKYWYDLFGQRPALLNSGCSWVTAPNGFHGVKTDGSTGYMTVGSMPVAANGATWEGRVTIASFNSFACMFSCYDGGYFEVLQNGSALYMHFPYPNNEGSPGGALVADTWYTVTLTATTGGVVSLYVNGLPYSSTSGSYRVPTANTAFYFGSRSAGGNLWNGRFASMAAFNRPLSGAEILARHKEVEAGFPTLLRRVGSRMFATAAATNRRRRTIILGGVG